jgi:predicted nucleic-acid-binding protein
VIALDTNVLVRYLVEDDAKQTRVAASLIERVVETEESLFVSDIVVCETVWVLSYSYRFSRSEIARVLQDLFRARRLAFASSDQLIRALAAYASGKGDFSDYLIREQALAAGYDQVGTFDKALFREAGFVALR